MKLTEVDKDFISHVVDYSQLDEKTIMHVLQYLLVVSLMDYTKDKGDTLGTIPYVGTVTLSDQIPGVAVINLNKDFNNMLKSIKSDNILALSDYIKENLIEPRVISACESGKVEKN